MGEYEYIDDTQAYLQARRNVLSALCGGDAAAVIKYHKEAERLLQEARNAENSGE